MGLHSVDEVQSMIALLFLLLLLSLLLLLHNRQLIRQNMPAHTAALAHLLTAAASLEVLLPYDRALLPQPTVAVDCRLRNARRSVYHRLSLQPRTHIQH